MSNWIQKKCGPCIKGTPPKTDDEVNAALNELPGWSKGDQFIERVFSFNNYYETVSFVNAVVWIAHREDHHPDVSFGYKQCHVRFSTHSIGGLSDNDFICAAKINALI